jgi:alkylhydroperoxidase/carboxymuconolactone decarboxylase family protein YurZ
MPSMLGYLYLYALLGYREGIEYQTVHARYLGATNEAILQTLELAFIRAGPRGMHAARSAAGPTLRTPGPSHQAMMSAFPPAWSRDPAVFACDGDPRIEGLSAAEEKRIRTWYERYVGEVPSFVDFLIRIRPALMKAYWLRLEGAMQGPLPNQVVPFFEIIAGVATSNAPLVRAAIGMARGLGLRREEVIEAITWGTFYGGPETVALAEEPLDRVFGEHQT